MSESPFRTPDWKNPSRATPTVLSRCRHHAWISVDALLEACFIGIVASPREDSSDSSVSSCGRPGPPPGSPVSILRREDASSAHGRRATWDESNLTANDAERGIEYGTMKIEQPETPFLCAHARIPPIGTAPQPCANCERRPTISTRQVL